MCALLMIVIIAVDKLHQSLSVDWSQTVKHYGQTPLGEDRRMGMNDEIWQRP